MASPPFARIPSNNASALLACATRNIPVAPNPAPRFSDFQFRTIGQQPELLKRISAPNPDTHYDHDSDQLSPSLWPEQSLPPPESDSVKRPSLRDRLSLLESPAAGRDDAVDVAMGDALPVVDTRSTQSIDVPTTTSTSQAHGRHPDISSSEGLPTISRTNFPQNNRLGEEPDASQNMTDSPKQEQAIRTTTELRTTSTSDEPPFPIITTNSETQPRLSPLLTQTHSTVGVSTPFSSGEDVYSLMALRALQSRLSSSLSNINPISTTDALAAAQSAKDQCTEILTTADRAHTLAQHASLLAQDSMVAAQDCLNVAATVRDRVDLALIAVEKIRSGQDIGSSGECEYNTTVKALKDDISELAEWVCQRDAYESMHLRQLEDKIEKRKKELALQLERESNQSPIIKPLDLNTHINPPSLQTGILETCAMTVEDEADAATRAWNQHREQSAERKKLAELELRKRREAENELERQRLQAQSEVDTREAELGRLRAERRKAEEEERSRQEKEALELQRQQQELEIARFLRSQKQVQEDLAKVAAEKKKKAQAVESEREARSIAQSEQTRRELREKEVLKRQEIEEAKALLAASEAKRREKVMLERMKRVEAQQPPVSVDAVANILDKAKEKQSMATLTTDNRTPPPRYAPLPSPPMHQPPALSTPTHTEFGNVVSKKTLLTNSPRTSKQQNRTLSGSIRLDQPSNSVNLTSSDSSIPKPSIPMQEGAKPHQVIPSIPSSVDKLLLDHSTFGTSSHIREVDSKSDDGLLNGGSLSLPASMPPVDIPNSHATSSNDFENMHIQDDPYAGNLSVVPPSRGYPVSVEVQHANLQPFMDATGISHGPGASDVHEQKSFSSSVDQPSVATEKSHRKPLSSSKMNGNQICRTPSANKLGSMKKPKLEPLDDIPILSIPSPPVAISVARNAPAKTKTKLSHSMKNESVSSITVPETPLSSGDLPAMPPSDLFPQPPELAVTQLDGTSLANPSVVSEGKVRPAAVRRNAPPLAGNQQPPIHVGAMNQTVQVSDLRVSPRMGPDAAVNDGWGQPVPMNDDVMPKAPRKQLPRRPPSVGRQNRLLPSRPRFPPSRIINDHYSPPRRRSGSRGYSPLPEYDEDRRSFSPEEMPVIGRKRYRDDNSVTHSPRRYRYNSPPDADRTATYERSPSLESRPKSLALRLESEKPPWKYQGGSSYRPTYNNSDSYAYESRSNKNPRYSPPHSQSISQGPSYHGDPSAQSNQPIRKDVMNNTHLPLLSRFTDSAEQTQPNHHGPTRSHNLRGPRGGGNQALEQRISKPRPVSLINRLEDAN